MGSVWPYNTLHWRRVRLRVLARDGRVCRASWPHECSSVATQVHHVVAPAEGGHPFDPVNLLSVCKPANVAERNARRAEWARRYIGEQADPVDVEVVHPW